MKSSILVVCCACLCCCVLNAQTTPKIKVLLVSDESVAATRQVNQLFKEKMTATYLFEIVPSDSAQLTLIVDCNARATEVEAYNCMYVGHYAGTTSKTLLGAGLWTSKTAGDAASSLLAAVAADISERWNSTMRSNQVESLEACLFLTESSCAVPETLVPDLKAKSINLSQYLRKGLKK
jgi:hypothetical protein